MKHTTLTKRNFADFALTLFAMGMVSVGFGAVDLLMIAPLGLQHIAAVSQGELITSALLAALIGLVDTFTARLAVMEGAGKTRERLPALVASFVVLALLVTLIASLIALSIKPVLTGFNQVPDLINPIADYVVTRLLSVPAVLAYVAANEALKICGMKSMALKNVIFGLLLNVGLNGLFLFSHLGPLFASPEMAVAFATTLAQTAMAGMAISLFYRRFRATYPGKIVIALREVVRQAKSMLLKASGIGVRHLNDYVSTVVPVLFIGTMSVQAVAAAGIATKLYTLFCRVPQACFGASFVYYGYSVDAASSQHDQRGGIVRKLLVYSTVPTVVALCLTYVFRHQLIQLFGNGSLNGILASSILLAYLMYVPAYFFEQLFGELLTVHQRSDVLLVASTLSTYLLTLPLTYFAAFHQKSAFATIAAKGPSTLLLALIFTLVFTSYLKPKNEVCHVIP